MISQVIFLKVEKIGSDILTIFMSNFYFKDIDIDKKIELIGIIKDYIGKIDQRYKLNLNGFYKIKVYPNKKIGVFLEIIKIDDNEFSSGADFRIIIYQNELFYFEIDDYDYIDKDIKKKYYKSHYYINVDDMDNIDQVIDFGNIIYGDKAKEILAYGINLN